jgi:hypothetical protein
VTKKPGGDGLAAVGRINAGTNNLGAVIVKGDLGNIDAGSGSADVPAVKSLSVRSMGIYGVATQGAGLVELFSDFFGALGSLKVTGDIKDVFIRVLGGASATIGSIRVGGSIIGGTLDNSGEIFCAGNMGFVKIGRDVLGSVGSFSGLIDTGGNLAGVMIGGSLIGGAGSGSASIVSTGDMGLVKIRDDVQGGFGNGSGLISPNGNLAGVIIGGSLIGGSGSNSGQIFSLGDMDAVKIGGDVRGGSISGTMATLDATGFLRSDHRIGGVSIGGSIVSGIDNSAVGELTRNATIRAGDDIGSLTVKGCLLGNVTANGASPVIISARGQTASTATSDVAIGKINIGGLVERAQVLAGYDTALTALNGNAQIGAVKVSGDWIASDLVAGVRDTGADGFGNATDAVIGGGPSIAKIASIAIKGIVVGSAAGGDHFGFVSHEIASFKSLGFAAVVDSPIELSLVTADVTVREV